MNFNELSETIHQDMVNVGWWDIPGQCIYEKLQLVSTEIAEATEGERKNLMDEHLPHRKMGEVELADALIRLLDIAGWRGWKYGADENILMSEFDDVDSIAGQHLICNMAICTIALCIKFHDSEDIDDMYSSAVDVITAVATNQGYDMKGAIAEKMKYNLARADHKRENRAKEGGKKF